MRARIAALAAVVVLLLAGCAEIPRTGDVRPGATELPNDTSIVYVPNPPAAGATQQDIVTGFLTAASAGGDFGVARQYLASSFAGKWRPRTRVLVQGAQPTITTTSSADLTLTLPVSGRVSDRGVYTTSSQTFPLRFHLVSRPGSGGSTPRRTGSSSGGPCSRRCTSRSRCSSSTPPGSDWSRTSGGSRRPRRGSRS